jgi:anti-anti-sigma factor
VLDLFGTLEAAELPNGDRVVAAHGPLDERIGGELRDVLLPLATGDGRLVLDLRDAHGVDAHALANIACAAQMLRHDGGRFVVVTQSPLVRKLVADAGLGDLVDLQPSLAEAIRVD